MSVPPTPLGDFPQCSGEPTLLCLSSDVPSSLLRFRPEVSESQKVKPSWPLPFAYRLRELHDVSLLRMYRQSVFPKSLRQYFHDSKRIFFLREYQHCIIRIPDHECLSPQPWFHHLGKPCVQHFMKVDITEYRGNHTSLGYSFLRIPQLFFLHHSRLQPLPVSTVSIHHHTPVS